jgi:hypothetical protein
MAMVMPTGTTMDITMATTIPTTEVMVEYTMVTAAT